jgi:hypothetical protein
MLLNFVGSLQGQCFIFGALCPSGSGLMKKHVVKHIVNVAKVGWFGLLGFPLIGEVIASPGGHGPWTMVWFGLVWFGGLFVERESRAPTKGTSQAHLRSQ